MSSEAGGPALSEQLARRYFALWERRDIEQLVAVVAPDVEIVLRSIRPGDTLRGRRELAALLEQIAGRFHEVRAEVFRPLDERRIVVEGRVRWMDEERVLRDDPMIWGLEFRSGLLARSHAAHSVLEAEALLAASQAGETAD